MNSLIDWVSATPEVGERWNQTPSRGPAPSRVPTMSHAEALTANVSIGSSNADCPASAGGLRRPRRAAL